MRHPVLQRAQAGIYKFQGSPGLSLEAEHILHLTPEPP
jgi:hypothetical protein